MSLDKKDLIKELFDIANVEQLYYRYYGFSLSKSDLIELIPPSKFYEYCLKEFDKDFSVKELIDMVEQYENYEVRRCSTCGARMKEGYYVAGEYACSEECCLALYDGDRDQMNKDLEYDEEHCVGEVYYTEWDSYKIE